MDKLTEILEELTAHYYTTHNIEADDCCEREIAQALLAILAYFNEILPKEKNVYEHKKIQFGNGYVKQVDPRYNAGCNDTIAEIKANLGKEIK